MHKQKIDRIFHGNVRRAGETYPARLIIVAFTNRCGSNLFCEMIASDGTLPRGGEYLNAKTVEKISRDREIVSFSDYVSFMVSNHMKNGHFVVKASYEQIELLNDWGYLHETFRDVKYVHIVRYDILDQAISFAIAIQTKQWSSFQKNPTNSNPHFDQFWIEKITENIKFANRSISNYFLKHNIHPFSLEYESLIKNPYSFVERFGKIIDLPMRLESQNLRLKKQSTRRNTLWKHRILSSRKKQSYLFGYRFLSGNMDQEEVDFIYEFFETTPSSYLSGPAIDFGAEGGALLSILIECLIRKGVRFPLMAYGPFTDEALGRLRDDFQALYAESCIPVRFERAADPLPAPDALKAAGIGPPAFASLRFQGPPDRLERALGGIASALAERGVVSIADVRDPDGPAALGRMIRGQRAERLAKLIPFAWVGTRVFLCRPADRRAFFEAARATRRALGSAGNWSESDIGGHAVLRSPPTRLAADERLPG